MIKDTYISRPIQYIDVPAPSKPELSYVYNFFEFDERVDDNPPRLKKPLGALDQGELRRKVPRYVAVSWKKNSFDSSLGRSLESSVPVGFLKRNEGKISDESNIMLDRTILYLQDFYHEIRLGSRFESSAKLRGVLSGSPTDVAANLTLSREKFSTSAVDVNGETSTFEEQSNLIQRYLGLVAQSRQAIIRDGAQIDPFDSSTAQRINVIIDNQYARSAGRYGSSSPVSQCAAVAKSNATRVSKQVRFRSNKLPTRSELEPELPALSSTTGFNSPAPVEHLGYLIERYEMMSDGQINNRRLFYIDGTGATNVTSYLDFDVKYGVQYVYGVRSVASFKSNAYSSTGGPLLGTFLIASPPSDFSTVLTVERVPPPPPADVNFIWDYQRSALHVGWQFPSNPQRDIKGWQIFRRKNVNEPFSLIAQIDFDDSVVKTPPTEDVDPSLIKKYSSPVNFYVDSGFDKDSDYIYSICSIDAHAMTSNYSTQFRVMFDRVKNKLVKNYISRSGAPKQYPNTYLSAELSLDSVKSSNCRKIRVYFDPEYLRVENRDGGDLKLLKTDLRGGFYRFTLLNTDRQRQSDFDITISDLRREPETS